MSSTHKKLRKKAILKLASRLAVAIMLVGSQGVVAETPNQPQQLDSTSRNDTDPPPFNGEPYSSSTKWDRFVTLIRHPSRSLSIGKVETAFSDKLVKAKADDSGLQYRDPHLELSFGVDNSIPAARRKAYWLSISFLYLPLSEPAQCVPRQKAISNLQSIGFLELPDPPLTPAAIGALGLPMPDTVRLARGIEIITVHFGLVGSPPGCLTDEDFTTSS
jgi:hypothetical protein